MDTSREMIEMAIAPLLRRRYVVVSTRESMSGFGDVEIQLRSAGVTVRLTSDRAQIFVDVALLDATRGGHTTRRRGHLSSE